MKESDVATIDDTVLASIRPIKLQNQEIQQKVEETVTCFRPRGDTILRIARIFNEEMDRGLNDQTSSLLMSNTHVPELPKGNEEGEFLTLDLGGTNFRVVLVVLKAGKVVDEVFQKYHISSDLKTGCGLELFDYLADCIVDFINRHDIKSKVIPLGFTFSFPMEKNSLDSAILKTWTKSFTASSVEGNDVVDLLKAALERHQSHKNNVKVCAVINDTTGTLIYGASIDPRTRIGLVLGTGSNACYMEKASRVKHWGTNKHTNKEVVVNIEWGAFGDNGLLDFIKTEFDQEVDNNSLIAKSYTFEKYISGKYMGEIVRAVLVKLANKGLIFGGRVSPKFATPNSFTTDNVSHIEEDTINGTTRETERVLLDYELSYSMDDIQVVKLVCEMVSLRAAILVSTCLSVVLKRIQEDSVTIAVDGSLFKHHPRFEFWMNQFIKILAPAHPAQFVLAEDGSGKGAALTAAVALSLKTCDL